jgi:hypothetical protein
MSNDAMNKQNENIPSTTSMDYLQNHPAYEFFESRSTMLEYIAQVKAKSRHAGRARVYECRLLSDFQPQ